MKHKVFLLILLAFFITSVSASLFGYNSNTNSVTVGGNKTINNNYTTYTVYGANASSITCGGTDKISAFDNATGAFTCTTDESTASGNCSDGSCATVFYWLNQSALNETDKLLSINTTGNVQELLNNTGIYSTFNATYDAYAENVSTNWTQRTYDTYNSIWGADSENASWNESYADTLYAGAEWEYNQTEATYNLYDTRWYQILWDATFNNSLTNFVTNWLSGLTTDNITEGSLNRYDNQSWNEGYADGLYASIGSGSDNSSWNESYADTLYANIQWNYNQTTGAITLLNATYGTYWFNQTASLDTQYLFNQTQGLAIEYLFNQTASLYLPNWTIETNKTLYDVYGTYWFNQTQSLGDISDNSSWNEGYADTLYANIQWNYNQTTGAINLLNVTYGTYWFNQTQSLATEYLFNQTAGLYLPNWTTETNKTMYDVYGTYWFNQTANLDLGGNSSWNESLANTLYINQSALNTTQFEWSNGFVHLVESWFETAWNNLFRNWFNQDLNTTATPTFSNVTLSSGYINNGSDWFSFNDLNATGTGMSSEEVNLTILQYLNIGTNASYLDRSNESLASFNTTANVQALINNTNLKIANITLGGGGYIIDNGTTTIIGHT